MGGVEMKHQTSARRTRSRTLAIALACALGVLACASPPAQIEDDRVTVGTVQGNIEIGLSAARVVEVLGSPNIVTTDEQRREVWVYDKVSTDRVDTANSSYGTLIILGGRRGSSSSSQRQRTLTIIIYFDEQKKVRDFAYNATQF
jgi:outer membrane protein assembly factor BamE (lipoprotein component of BamABCDE complex)